MAETSTETLRRLLDERGVEWFESVTRKGLTWIYRDGKAIRFHPWQPDTLKVSMFDLTPEQAIYATLGDVPRLPYFWTADGTLHIELPKLPESISVRLPDQRDREVGSARVWQYTQGVADTEAYQVDTDGLDCEHVRNSSAYEAGYRDGSIHYELEHCPACKNIADLQEALEENAKLRELAAGVGYLLFSLDVDYCGACTADNINHPCPVYTVEGGECLYKTCMRELRIEVG